MKILHIASFQGNVGDNASHIGFYSILDDLLDEYEVVQLEIRNYYKSYSGEDKKSFDSNFIKYLNTFDFCFIGGGGFLDYWVPDSKTGTTIDIDPVLIKEIKKPTYFVSIGCNPHKKIPENNKSKFRFFLDEVKKNNKIKIAIRNDGSIESIEKDIGAHYLNDITEILDHGFFYTDEIIRPRIINKEYIAINITEDQLYMKSRLRKKINKKSYLREFGEIVNHIFTNIKCDVVFVPHIYSDLKAIYEILETLNDNDVRRYVTIAPCIQGFEGARNTFSVYENSKCVIASRLHANICSIALSKKTIGLVALDRVEYLYRSLGISGNSVLLEGDFSKKVIELLSYNSFLGGDNLPLLKQKTLDYYKDIFHTS